MWFKLYVALIAVAYASAWRHETGEYIYRVYTSNVVSLNGEEHTGFQTQMNLHVAFYPGSRAKAKFDTPQMKDISSGPQQNQTFQQLALSRYSFYIGFDDNGLVNSLKVANDLPTYEKDFIRAVTSLFQVDLRSIDNVNSVYSKMESSVSGKCEVEYRSKQAGKDINISKFKNYTNCEYVPVLSEGFQTKDNIKSTLTTENHLLRESESFIMIQRDEVYNFYSITSVATTNSVKLVGNVDKEDSKDKIDLVVSGINMRLIGNQKFMKKINEPTDRYEEIGIMDKEIRRFANDIYKTNDFSSEDLDRNQNDGYLKQTDSYKKQNKESKISVAMKLSRQISGNTYTLADISDIPKKSTMKKFTILVNILKGMTTEELAGVAQGLLFCEDCNVRIEEQKAWKIFINALQVTGTQAALELIANLVTDRTVVMKIDNYEDMFNVAVYADDLNSHYLETYFKMVTNLEEMDEDLYVQAIIGGSMLLRKTLNWPKAYGDIPYNLKMDIVQIYLPYFEQKLAVSLNNKVDVRRQAYIRAIGNIGLLKVFDTFYDYLNQGNISDFDKILMVQSMNEVVIRYPEQIKTRLYKLVLNSNVPDTGRILSFLHLLKTKPNVEMLVKLISQTKMDTLPESVRSAINIGIREETNNMDQRMSKIAEEAMLYLPERNETDELISRKYTNLPQMPNLSMLSEAVAGNTDYDNTLIYQSEILNNINGYKMGGKVAFALSNWETFTSGSSSNSTGEPMTNLFIEFDNLGLFYGAVGQNLTDILQDVVVGLSTIDSETISTERTALGFPMETGMPFLYTDDNPMYLYLQKKTYPEKSYTKLHFAAAFEKYTKISVINSFTGDRHTAGIDQQLFVNLPVNISLDINGNAAITKISPLVRDIEQRLFHTSVWPYHSALHVDSTELWLNTNNATKYYVQAQSRGQWMKTKDVIETEMEIPDFDFYLYVQMYHGLYGVRPHSYPFGLVIGSHYAYDMYLDDNSKIADSVVIKYDTAVDNSSRYLPDMVSFNFGGNDEKLIKTFSFKGSVELTGIKYNQVALNMAVFSSNTGNISEVETNVIMDVDGSLINVCSNVYAQKRVNDSIYFEGYIGHSTTLKHCELDKQKIVSIEMYPERIGNSTHLTLIVNHNLRNLRSTVAFCQYMLLYQSRQNILNGYTRYLLSEDVQTTIIMNPSCEYVMESITNPLLLIMESE